MLFATVIETVESAEMVLASVVMARNSMTLVHSLTPEMLAFVRNITSAPSSQGPPTVMGLSRSNVYSSYAERFLHNIQVAREAYHQAEAKTKLHIALISKTRSEGFDGSLGDKVYYSSELKEKGETTRHGPGVICSKDQAGVLIRHSGSYIQRMMIPWRMKFHAML